MHGDLRLQPAMPRSIRLQLKKAKKFREKNSTSRIYILCIFWSILYSEKYCKMVELKHGIWEKNCNVEHTFLHETEYICIFQIA